MVLKELQLLSEALWESVKSDLIFFRQFNCLLENWLSSITQTWQAMTWPKFSFMQIKLNHFLRTIDFLEIFMSHRIKLTGMTKLLNRYWSCQKGCRLEKEFTLNGSIS